MSLAVCGWGDEITVERQELFFPQIKCVCLCVLQIHTHKTDWSLRKDQFDSRKQTRRNISVSYEPNAVRNRLQLNRMAFRLRGPLVTWATN